MQHKKSFKPPQPSRKMLVEKKQGKQIRHEIKQKRNFESGNHCHIAVNRNVNECQHEIVESSDLWKRRGERERERWGVNLWSRKACFHGNKRMNALNSKLWQSIIWLISDLKSLSLFFRFFSRKLAKLNCQKLVISLTFTCFTTLLNIAMPDFITTKIPKYAVFLLYRVY